MLELYATEGLNPGSVHLAQLRLGEGLVGTIAASARPLSLSDAQNHPAFAYLPGDGRGDLSLVPGRARAAGRSHARRSGRAEPDHAAVPRREELEALETVAMVIAEMVASGELSRLTRPGLELDLSRPVTFKGLAFNDGIGLGHCGAARAARGRHQTSSTRIATPNSNGARGSAGVACAFPSDDMLSRREIAFDGEHREVLEAYRMFANDRGWGRRLEEAVLNGLTAEAAAEKVQSDMRARMLHMTDPYLRERMSDFDDLANRLLRLLVGQSGDDMAEALPRDAVVVARSMGRPSSSTTRASGCAGWCWREGALTSHVVIVARAIGIPVAGQMIGRGVDVGKRRCHHHRRRRRVGCHLRPQRMSRAAYAGR